MDPDTARQQIELGTLQPHTVVEGSLSLKNLPIPSLPSGFKTSGDLHLEGIDDLTALPPGLGVGGELWVQRCPELRRVGQGLQVVRSAILANCPALEELPAELTAARIALTNCPKLTQIPGSIRVGALAISGCPAITSLPEGLSLQSLDLGSSGSLAIRDLPESLRGVSLLVNQTPVTAETFLSPPSVGDILVLDESEHLRLQGLNPALLRQTSQGLLNPPEEPAQRRIHRQRLAARRLMRFDQFGPEKFLKEVGGKTIDRLGAHQRLHLLPSPAHAPRPRMPGLSGLIGSLINPLPPELLLYERRDTSPPGLHALRLPLEMQRCQWAEIALEAVG